MADIENIRSLLAGSGRGLLDDHRRALDEERQQQAAAADTARATAAATAAYRPPSMLDPKPVHNPLAEMEAADADEPVRQAPDWFAEREQEQEASDSAGRQQVADQKQATSWAGTDTRLDNGTPGATSGPEEPSLGSPSGKPQPAAARPTPKFPAPIRGKTRQGPKEQSERERAARLRRHDTTSGEVKALTEENRAWDAAAPPSRQVTRTSAGGTVPGWGEKGRSRK